jgi:hypoxanthine phosphoribosyltransferase
MEKDFARILLSRERIAERVAELAKDIARCYGDDTDGLVIVSILSGSIIFLADLIRCLPIKMKLGLITMSRYRGATTTGGATQLVHDLAMELEGRHVLVLDDILDTGNTLRMVMDQLRVRGPASLRMCVLLRKPAKAPKDVTADFVGFDIDDVFVVGYGLDYNDHYRNAPDIAVLRPELYA